MSTYWWEALGPSGLPRFYIYSTPTQRQNYRRLIVVEMKPDAVDLPVSTRIRNHGIQRTLLRTEPLYWGAYFPSNNIVGGPAGPPGKRAKRVWDRAERVVTRLASMPLSLMAVEQQKGGIQKLFDKLWLEDVEQYDEIYPRRSLRRA